MFAATVQPPTISLFSSTSSQPLQLFSQHCDISLESDSFIHLLNDKDSEPLPPPPATLVSLPVIHGSSESNVESPESLGYHLCQTVLHIQSPTLRSTYILSPPSGVHFISGRITGALGIKHPWVHVQVRNIGRAWSFEVGIVDQSGRLGVLRLSTFQKHPRVVIPNKLDSPPLLHLPLSFPTPSSRPLTSWCNLALNLPSFIPYFSSPSLLLQDDDHTESPIAAGPHSHGTWTSRNSAALSAVPSGVYSHVAYVKVYATCRLRRIWFGEGGPNQKVPWEFELYSDE